MNMRLMMLLATMMMCAGAAAFANTEGDGGGRFPASYHEHQEADAATKDVSYNAQGTLLAVASYEEVGEERHGDIVVYDVATEQPRYRFDATAAFCAAISPDGSKLAAWVLGEGFVIRDMPDTSRHKVVLRDRREELVFKCAFAPDGKTIALAGPGGKVRIMDVATGNIVKVLVANNRAALTVKVTYTRDSRLVAAGGDIIRVWNTKTWNVLRDILPPAGDSVLVSAVSEGSSRVVCAYAHNTYVYDLATGKELFRRDVGHFYNAAYSASGNLILLSSREGVFAFHKDLSSVEMNGQGMPGIEWLAIDPKDQQVAFATERQFITADYGALVKLSGPLSSTAENLMAGIVAKPKEQRASKTKVVAAPKTVVKSSVAKVATVASGDKCISGNCKTGFGKMRYADSSYYEGGWVDGKRQGIGTFEDAENIYTGMWQADIKSDSGVFVAKNITRAGKLSSEIISIGRVIAGNLSGPGTHMVISFNGTKPDTSLVLKGNFADGELSGKGSAYIPGAMNAYSDSWTDNYHFSSGKMVRANDGGVEEGSYAMGAITPIAGAAHTQSSSASSSGSSGSMLDYGIFNYRKNEAPAGGKAHDYKVYCFVSTCSGSGKTFKVLSKVTADISKHSMDEIKAEATHRMSNNGWYVQGSTDYVGTADNMNVAGTPGRDYAVSEAALYDF